MTDDPSPSSGAEGRTREADRAPPLTFTASRSSRRTPAAANGPGIGGRMVFNSNRAGRNALKKLNRRTEVASPGVPFPSPGVPFPSPAVPFHSDGASLSSPASRRSPFNRGPANRPAARPPGCENPLQAVEKAQFAPEDPMASTDADLRDVGACASQTARAGLPAAAKASNSRRGSIQFRLARMQLSAIQAGGAGVEPEAPPCR